VNVFLPCLVAHCPPRSIATATGVDLNSSEAAVSLALRFTLMQYGGHLVIVSRGIQNIDLHDNPGHEP
jgi:hypothetical protein